MVEDIKGSTPAQGTRKTCLLFSGQGSQYRQMGRELYDGVASYSRDMDRLDQIVFQETGVSIVAELYGEERRKSDPFDQTALTHPAIFMVQLSLARALMAGGVRVEAVLGSSLGEYVAAVVAGAVDGEAMMRAIARCANAVEHHCAPGAMMSVLASDQLYHADPKARNTVTFVGTYMDQLFVVAGSVDAIQDMHAYWNGCDVVSVVLPVSHAFHSAAMDACSDALQAIFSQLYIAAPKIPFYSSLLGGRAHRLDAQHFLRVGREPIQFAAALKAMVGRSKTDYNFIDVGPFGSLAGIVKQSLAAQGGARCDPLLSPFANSQDLFAQLVAQKTLKA